MLLVLINISSLDKAATLAQVGQFTSALTHAAAYFPLNIHAGDDIYTNSLIYLYNSLLYFSPNGIINGSVVRAGSHATA